MSLEEALLPDLAPLLNEKLHIAYLQVDAHMRMKAVSDYFYDYGFARLSVGQDVREKIDFLIGIEAHQALDLPLMLSPNNKPITLTLTPVSEDSTIILLLDATVEYEQQQLLQQKANEVQLLLHEQNRLMAELKQARSTLEQKNVQLVEAARLQSGFLSGVSHEFRTPLASIIGYANLLSKGTQDDPYVAAIKRSSKYLLSLVENLLDHGKFESNQVVLHPKKVVLKEVLDDVYELMQPLAETKNIKLDFDAHIEDALVVYLDDTRLRQCLINVIGNAIKFTDIGKVHVRADWCNDGLAVQVQDTGVGIRNEDIEKVTLSFWQASDTGKVGTGLGLTITGRMLEMMGGDLTISSTFQKGTTVSFQIPVPALTDTEAVIGTIESDDTEFAKSWRILLVEDDPEIAVLVKLLLMERGAEVDHVENGAIALDKVAQASYDLILMDIHMPVMDGYEATRKIRASGSAVPVLAMTASAIEEDKSRALASGCDGYLVKPVDIDDLFDVAKQIITGG